MKKAILLLVAILGIVSCGKSDDKSDNNSVLLLENLILLLGFKALGLILKK